MTNEKQIRLVAEMDGWTFNGDGLIKNPSPYGTPTDECVLYLHHPNVPKYLTSRDAIIPVIEKWWAAATQEKREQFIVELMSILPIGSPVMLIFVKASELAEALIRTEGKWEDDTDAKTLTDGGNDK